MGLLSEVAHEGEAFIGHKQTEKIFHFGIKNKKLNKMEGNLSYALAGASGKVSVGDSTRGAALEGNAVVGRVGMGYSVDYTFPIPKCSLKMGANIAEFAAKANANRQEMEYKVFSAGIAGPSVSASASVGGKTVLPTATFEAHTLDTSASLGGGIELGVGNGANMSASYGMDAIKPDKGTIKELWENGSKIQGAMQGAMNSPREERPKKVLGLFQKANAEKSSLGNSSANLSGVGSVERDSSGEVTVENGLGIDTYTNGKAFVKAIFGTNGLYRTTGLYRNKLLENAENQHNKNIERLQKNDGRDGFFIRRSNKAVADKSSGYVDKLNGVINQAALRKQSIDRKLENATPGTRKADRLTAQSQKWGNIIDKYTDIRDKISGDKDRANANLERVSHTHSSEVAPRSTDQIVADAMKHVQDFQGAIRHKGIGASAEEATNLGGSKIELNQRIGERDRKLNENYKDLQNIIRRRETLDPNDPERLRLNDAEKRIRNENKALRAEKGECQKAYNETDKNFSPRESSENFEQRDRALQAERIDNENAKAAVEDDIAICCNENGIVKDTNGNYPQDPELQNLLDKKNALEKRGNEIQNDIDQNKKDWAKSENLGRHSIKVELDENNGEILVKQEGDDYGARVQDNEDLRDNNSGDSNNQQNQNEQNRQPSEDNNNNVQQSQSGQEDQQHQPSEGSNNEQNSQSQQSSEIGNDGHNQSEQSGQSQQPVENNNVQESQSGQSSQPQQPAGNSNNQQGQSEQGNQPLQPSEGNNTQQSTSEQNSQPQQPVENNNVQQSQSGQSSQPQQPVENNNVQQSQSGGSSQSQQPAGNSHNQQGQSEQGNQPLQPSEGNNNTQQSTSEQNSQSQQPVENNNNVQQSQSGESSQPQQPVENNNVQQRQSGGSSQPQQPAGNSHNQQGQSEQGNQPLQPSEGNNNTQQSTSEQNSQPQQPVENNNVQQSQSELGNQSRSTSDENADQNASTIHDSERHFQPTQGQSSAQEHEGSLGMPARAVNANQIASGEVRQNSSAEMPTRAVGQNGTQEQGASAGMPTRAARQNGTQDQGASAGMPTRAVGQNGTQEQGASAGMPTRAAGQNGTQEQGASAGMPTRAARQNETQEQGASAGMPTRAARQNETQEQGASAGMPTRAAGQSGSASSNSSGQSHSSGQSM